MSYTSATFLGDKWYNCPEGDGLCGTTTCPNGTQVSTVMDPVDNTKVSSCF